jgi:ABC-type multidrug transport system fused ATPase/permease subunit
MPIQSLKVQAEFYRSLRLAIVFLLLALAASVFYQTIHQGSFLQSVSAYYYTPAQPVFVAALIGFGVMMIAMQGLSNAENVFLRLAGIFAIAVALIPTRLSGDFQTAVQACQKSGGTSPTQQVKNLNCATILATRASVENNVAAALIAGGLALVLIAVILFKGGGAKTGTSEGRWALAALFASTLLWLGGLIALAVSVDWLGNYGHVIGGIGLLVCVLLVAGANAYRQERPTMGSVPKGKVLKSPGDHLFMWLAIVMLVISGVLIGLWQSDVISLFDVEMPVAFLFALFWTVQTIEIERGSRSSRPGSDVRGPTDNVVLAAEAPENGGGRLRQRSTRAAVDAVLAAYLTEQRRHGVYSDPQDC